MKGDDVHAVRTRGILLERICFVLLYTGELKVAHSPVEVYYQGSDQKLRHSEHFENTLFLCVFLGVRIHDRFGQGHPIYLGAFLDDPVGALVATLRDQPTGRLWDQPLENHTGH